MICVRVIFGVWAKGEPPALGAGHQVGSIPTTPTFGAVRLLIDRLKETKRCL